MLLSIGILISAAALAAAAIIFRKKIGLSWMISLFAAAAAMIITGSTMLSSVISLRSMDRQYVYCALEYLRTGKIDDASYYIKKTSGGDTKKDRFVQLGAQTVLEQMRGNDLIARLRLDAMKGISNAENYQLICLKAEAVTSYDYSTVETAVAALKELLGLKGKTLEKAENRYQAENSYYAGMEVGEGNPLNALSQADQYKARINAALRQHDYMGAIENAAQLVELRASASNRMLLAETIAEAVFEGISPSGSVFVMSPDQKQSSDDEIAEYTKKIDTAQPRYQDLQLLYTNTADERQQSELQKKIDVQQKIIEEASQQMTNLFVYRAISSIADIHSTQADVVRARLAYAIRDYDSAMDAVTSAANSLGARLTGDTTLRNAYSVFRNSHNGGDTLGVQSVEYKEAMKTILTNGSIDMVGVSSSALTNSFVEYIAADLKTYGQSLFITSVNTDHFPEIVVTLSGRDTVIDSIKDEKGLLVRDSHKEVRYAVRKPNADMPSIVCCVVDESGSMGGAPILDLKSALETFVDAMPETTKLGILGFEDNTHEIAPIGSNKATLRDSIQTIGAYGGTNISAGITAAVEACSEHEGRKTILLMTDGQSDINMAAVREAADAGITINTIGFGDVNSSLLTQIADITGGQYIHALSSAELSNIYMSLVGLIDNEIEICYTVDYAKDDPGEHYIYIRTDKTGDNVRRVYQISQNFIDFSVFNVTPAVMNIHDLQDNPGNDRVITLHGAHFNRVKSVSVNGKEITPDIISDDQLEITVPASELIDGWQKLILTLDDGTVYTYDHAIVTGIPVRQNEFFMGNKRFYSPFAVMTNNGTLVLQAASVSDDTGMADFSVSDLLAFENVPGMHSEQGDGEVLSVTLPGTGTWIGSGIAYYGAGQHSFIGSGASNDFYRGTFTLACEKDKIRLLPVTVSGN